jgi:hypothetical protein
MRAPSSAEAVAGRVDQPVEDEHDGHELVHGEVDPGHGRLQLRLKPGEQQREDDPRDRQVEHRRASRALDQRRTSLPIPRTFDWIVKKLKKFAFWKSLSADSANW